MEHVARERLLTADDLLTMPDDEQRHELVSGFLLCEPPASFGHGKVAGRIFLLLGAFVQTRNLGVVVSADTGFLLARDPDTVRAPDVAFISHARAQEVGEVRSYFPGPPDLAVEVLSPSDRTGEVHGKVADYLAAGSRLVWVVDPRTSRVLVHRTLLSPRTLEGSDILDGEDVLPGFQVMVAELFAD